MWTPTRKACGGQSSQEAGDGRLWEASPCPAPCLSDKWLC